MCPYYQNSEGQWDIHDQQQEACNITEMRKIIHGNMCTFLSSCNLDADYSDCIHFTCHYSQHWHHIGISHQMYLQINCLFLGLLLSILFTNILDRETTTVSDNPVSYNSYKRCTIDVSCCTEAFRKDIRALILLTSPLQS